VPGPSPAPCPLITLLTDFGAGSGYAAQMKGVILCALAGASIVDLSHEIPAYDVLAGALVLEACVPRFPLHAVHCAVIDPGVGTSRRPVCLEDAAGRRFVGPDNGLFTPFLHSGHVYLLAERTIVPEPASTTFHGRDLFAPVAAYLAAGGKSAALGPAVEDPVRLRWPIAERRGDDIHGECLLPDPFGNVLTSIRSGDLAGQRPLAVSVGGRPVRFVATFGEGRPGEVVALLGSGGRVEIAVREASAAQMLGCRRGDPVMVKLGARERPPP